MKWFNSKNSSKEPVFSGCWHWEVLYPNKKIDAFNFRHGKRNYPNSVRLPFPPSTISLILYIKLLLVRIWENFNLEKSFHLVETGIWLSLQSFWEKNTCFFLLFRKESTHVDICASYTYYLEKRPCGVVFPSKVLHP